MPNIDWNQIDNSLGNLLNSTFNDLNTPTTIQNKKVNLLSKISEKKKRLSGSEQRDWYQNIENTAKGFINNLFGLGLTRTEVDENGNRYLLDDVENKRLAQVYEDQYGDIRGFGNDGDTFQGNRLLNVDTPESIVDTTEGSSFYRTTNDFGISKADTIKAGQLAKEFNYNLIKSNPKYQTATKEGYDYYGRPLISNPELELRTIAEGYGVPNRNASKEYFDAYEYAKANNKGLFGKGLGHVLEAKYLDNMNPDNPNTNFIDQAQAGSSRVAAKILKLASEPIDFIFDTKITEDLDYLKDNAEKIFGANNREQIKTMFKLKQNFEKGNVLGLLKNIFSEGALDITANSLPESAMYLTGPTAALMITANTNDALDEAKKNNNGKSASLDRVVGTFAGEGLQAAFDRLGLSLGLSGGMLKVLDKAKKPIFNITKELKGKPTNYLKKFIVGNTKALSKFTAGTATEAITEPLQDAIRILEERLGTEKYKDKDAIQLISDAKEQLKESFYSGLAAGGLMTGVSRGIREIPNINRAIQDKAIEQKHLDIAKKFTKEEFREYDKQVKNVNDTAIKIQKDLETSYNTLETDNKQDIDIQTKFNNIVNIADKLSKYEVVKPLINRMLKIKQIAEPLTKAAKLLDIDTTTNNIKEPIEILRRIKNITQKGNINPNILLEVNNAIYEAYGRINNGFKNIIELTNKSVKRNVQLKNMTKNQILKTDPLQYNDHTKEQALKELNKIKETSKGLKIGNGYKAYTKYLSELPNKTLYELQKDYKSNLNKGTKSLINREANFRKLKFDFLGKNTIFNEDTTIKTENTNDLFKNTKYKEDITNSLSEQLQEYSKNNVDDKSVKKIKNNILKDLFKKYPNKEDRKTILNEIRNNKELDNFIRDNLNLDLNTNTKSFLDKFFENNKVNEKAIYDYVSPILKKMDISKLSKDKAQEQAKKLAEQFIDKVQKSIDKIPSEKELDKIIKKTEIATKVIAKRITEEFNKNKKKSKVNTKDKQELKANNKIIDDSIDEIKKEHDINILNPNEVKDLDGNKISAIEIAKQKDC